MVSPFQSDPNRGVHLARIGAMRPLARLALISCALCIAACASPAPRWVLPREDGTNSAISLAREESTASLACVAAAQDYCNERALRPVFLSEQTEYQGVLTGRGEKLARVARRIPVVGDE